MRHILYSIFLLSHSIHCHFSTETAYSSEYLKLSITKSEHILKSLRKNNVTAKYCFKHAAELQKQNKTIICQADNNEKYNNIQETEDRGWICVDEQYGIEVSCKSLDILQCTDDRGTIWLVGDDCPNWGGLGFTGIFLMFAALGLLGVGFFIIFSGMKKRLPSMPPQIPIYEEVEEKN